jgi:septal ring factor EnvC (AmiA/AmiB activator)
MPPVAKTILKNLSIIWLGVAIVLGHRLNVGAEASLAVVRVDSLNFRSAPATGGQPLYRLRKGDQLRVLEVEAGWLRVEHNGTVGYVRNDPRFVDTTLARDQAEEKKQTVARDLAAHREQLATLAHQAGEVMARLEILAQTLDQGRRQIVGLQRAIEDIDRQIADASRKSRELKTRITQNENIVSRRLVALYKLNWLGTLNLLASVDSVNDLVQRRSALGYILEDDAKTRDQLFTDLEHWQRLQRDLEQHRADKQRLEHRHQERLKALEDEKAQRAGLLANLRSRQELAAAAIEALQQSARSLDAAIETLNRSSASDEKRSAVAPGSFGRLKGLLKSPVRGKIINFFGPFKNTRYNIVNFRSGVDIKADRGEPIQAVAGGRVLYAEWFKNYGNMLIIDHGHNYCTLYAHLEEVFKQKGEPVEGGEVVATVGDSGSLGDTGLYFEVRHHGKPEDPLQWLIEEP